MQYRSVADLSRLVWGSLDRIPHDVDVVIGIPRSGLLVANLVALALNKPMADAQGFSEGRILAAGRTRRRAGFDLPASGMRSALVVDDSADSGSAMAAARSLLLSARPDMSFTFLVAFGTAKRMEGIDTVLEVVPHPRMFQWNALHHVHLGSACVDIDGVLCADPTEEENDDGPRYRRFLAETRPLVVPTKEIGCLVTNRLEKYRPETESWLARHGIRYRTLRMLDVPTKSDRQALPCGSFKASVYASSDAIVFIESEADQAIAIAASSGKPVLAWDDQFLARPGPFTLPAARVLVASSPSRAKSVLRAASAGCRRMLRRIIGDGRYAALKRLVRGTNG